MSMMFLTSDSAARPSPAADVGFFARLGAAMRIARALESGAPADPSDLDTLGIAAPFAAYQEARKA